MILIRYYNVVSIIYDELDFTELQDLWQTLTG